jgi:hypothetical protein
MNIFKTFFKLSLMIIISKILGVILIIGDIWYVWHLGFNSVTFSDWVTTLWFIVVAIIGVILVFIFK